MRLRRLRRASQIAFATLFVGLLLAASVAGVETISSSRFFFAIDPLLAVSGWLAAGTWTVGCALALIPVVITLLLGRFFCGWVCPLGALNHAVSWLGARLGQQPRRPAKRWTGARFLVLGVVLVLAVGGSGVGLLLDPIALLSRSLSAFVLPAAGVQLDLWSVPGSAPHAVVMAPPNQEGGAVFGPSRASRRTVAQAASIGSLFLVILLLNLHTRRFFCNYVCPLGGLYGLLARFSRLQVRTGDACTKCAACNLVCSGRKGALEAGTGQDCLLCLNCVAECEFDAAHLRVGESRALRRPSLDRGRRVLLLSLAVGLGASAIASLSSAAAAVRRRFLRPPGALHEDEFLERCLRCGQCLQACPSGFLQPLGLSAGSEGLWTPVGAPAYGGCAWDCNLCTRVCPTGAIRRLSLNDKRSFKIGTAVVDRSRCYTWADGMPCTVCAAACPIPGGAIHLREDAAWSFTGERVSVTRAYVDPEVCTGCGICEHVCPRQDAPGIKVGYDDEQRAGGFESIGTVAR